MNDSKVEMIFIVHHQQFGLPDLFFEMHPCGLHICYPKKMGEFGFIQTVKDMPVLLEQWICLRRWFFLPLWISGFRAILSAGGVPGSDVTLKDIKAAEVIWERSILKTKGNTVRRNSKKVAQSIIKVPTELIKLHQDDELAIGIFLSTNTSSSWPTSQR